MSARAVRRRCAARPGRTLALLLAAVLPGPARAEVGALRYDPKADVALTAAAAAVSGALSTRWLRPSGCNVCGTNELDERVRDALVWRAPGNARLASDVIASGVLPVGAAASLIASASRKGRTSAALVDLLVVGEAVAFAELPNAIAKDAFARRRPNGGNSSFYSGHTSLAFSVAAAAGTVSTMRGYEAAPWVWAGGMALAAGVGYLRVAGDAHWATDVVAGAAMGGLIGFAVPWFLHRPAGAGRRWTAVSAPGGLAILF